MERSEFKKGDILFHQGSTDDSVLRIVQGEVEVSREIEGRTIVVLGHARAGEWLGEMAVIENRNRSATARATMDGVAEVFTAEQFLDLISRNPAMARDVILRLSVRLRRVDAKFASVVANTADIGDPHEQAHQEAGPHKGTGILLMANTDPLRARIGASAIPVEKLPFVVGRVHLDAEDASPTAPDLLIEDSPPFRLSRQHFMIARSSGQLLASDLGSTLGTIVNGQPIGHHFTRDAAPLVSGNNDIVAGGRGSLFQFTVSVD